MESACTRASNQDEHEQQSHHHHSLYRHESALRDRVGPGGRGPSVTVDPALSAKWAALYPDETVAVVTSTSKPPMPPRGYVPLRVGHARPNSNNNNSSSSVGDESASPIGFSLDTLLWNEKLLEDRLSQLNAWTRRSPPTQRQQLDRINWLRHLRPMTTLLLLRWLNDELQLPRRVEVLERDLSNGFVFAQVLHACGLEPHLEQYQDSAATSAKVHNMEQLALALEAAGVPFPVRLRRSVMMEDRSAILQLLLQVKDVAQRRRGKTSATPAAVAAVHSRVYADASANSREDALPRDVDERFVTETALKLQPTAVAFRKDVDMAVHLRRFEQAQWTAENELREFQANQNAAQAAGSAAGMHAVRTHLNDKRAFMKEWDANHLAQWSATQRLRLMAEQDDLRLELALQERARIHARRTLDGIQRDASEGVVNFEKNLTRLGLGGVSAVGGNASALRAISAADEGALAHFRQLEQRVEELAFRPSNNVRMMKELRARRKAQLAAEKDRRMRRQKSGGGETASPIQVSTKAVVTDLDADLSTAPTNAPRNIREAYLESKRAELEANYDRLREVGSVRRDADALTLLAIRADGSRKADAHKWALCADAAEALIGLAVDVATRCTAGEAVDMDELKRTSFLVMQPTRLSQAALASEDEADDYELDELAAHFASRTGVWGEYFGGNGLEPSQSPPSSSDQAVEHLLQSLATPLASVSLDTTWTPKTAFAIVCVFTDDASGAAYPLRIALERGMQYASVDSITDECVQLSLDVQKPAEAAASPSERERELGALGAKANALKQKSAALPETLVVEMVAKFIGFLPRRAPPPQDDPKSELEPAAEHESVNGVVLHNFPRSLEEAKLFEKALIGAIASIVPMPATAPEAADEPEEPTSSRPPTASSQESRQVLFVAEKKSPECTESALPEQLRAAREQRRQTMDPCLRMLWLRASNDVALTEESVNHVLDTLAQMERKLHSELRARFRAIRDVLREVSAASARTRAALETQLDDCASLQSVLRAASARYRASGAGNERFFTELEVLLGDQVDEKRRAANAFVDALARNEAPPLLAAVDALFQALPSACFVLKEFAVEKTALLQHALFDNIPFLRDATRSQVEMPTEVASGAIDAAIGLSASSPRVTELVVEDVTHILTQIASLFSFRHAGGARSAREDETLELHERSVVSFEVRRLLERVTALCRFADHLKQRVRGVYAADIRRLQRLITDDLRAKNSAVDAIRSLAVEFLNRERLDSAQPQPPQPLRQDALIALLLDAARRGHFPGSWQSPTSLASLVLLGSSPDGTLSWRRLVSSVVRTQFLGEPTEQELVQCTQQAVAMLSADATCGRESGAVDEDLRLSRDQFARLPLWFDTQDAAGVDDVRDLLFLLFSSRTGGEEATVALAPMLLDCASTSSPGSASQSH
ncbi:hypothetical protein PybrP1_001583 [[Pythium] brassicae (nom. inval.)]|nr:hypothetical protein PybrP1_001583 [[Pythium] brassicae (nom. inval.)]